MDDKEQRDIIVSTWAVDISLLLIVGWSIITIGDVVVEFCKM